MDSKRVSIFNVFLIMTLASPLQLSQQFFIDIQRMFKKVRQPPRYLHHPIFRVNTKYQKAFQMLNWKAFLILSCYQLKQVHFALDDKDSAQGAVFFLNKRPLNFS